MSTLERGRLQLPPNLEDLRPKIEKMVSRGAELLAANVCARTELKHELTTKIKAVIKSHKSKPDWGLTLEVLLNAAREIYLEEGEGETQTMATREIRLWLLSDVGGGSMLAALDEIRMELRIGIHQEAGSELFKINGDTSTATFREINDREDYSGCHLVHSSGEELLINGDEPYAERVARLSEFLRRFFGTREVAS